MTILKFFKTFVSRNCIVDISGILQVYACNIYIQQFSLALSSILLYLDCFSLFLSDWIITTFTVPL